MLARLAPALATTFLLLANFGANFVAAAHAEDENTMRVLPRFVRIHTLEGHTKIVRCVGFKPGTHTLVSGGSDRSVRVWDADKGALLAASVLPRSG